MNLLTAMTMDENTQLQLRVLGLGASRLAPIATLPSIHFMSAWWNVKTHGCPGGDSAIRFVSSTNAGMNPAALPFCA
jgi:hypothetical protein